MQFLLTLTACVCLLAATETRADSRVFIVANQSDGYGVDECLAKGEKCGLRRRAPIASHGILRRLPGTAASIPMR